MKAELLKILACPQCLGSVITEEDRDPIQEGTLTCTECESEYFVQAGMPLLMVKDRYWTETTVEVEGEQEFVHELPFSEHIKRNHFEAGRTLRLLEQVEIPQNPILLDVGGSAGLGSFLFKDYSPEVVVTDIVPYFVQLAEVVLRNVMTVHGVPSSVEWLPFQNNSFDVVFCRQALHHSLEPIVAVREMFRVAKPGGLVLIASEPCLTIIDVMRKHRAASRGEKTGINNDGILSKLPDEQFIHAWPDFKGWISSVSDDFKIIPAGGSAATVMTAQGLVYDPYYRQQQWQGKLLTRILPGMRGFRGDLNIIARKTASVDRSPGREKPDSIKRGEWKIDRLDEETIRSQREVFPKMFPFPVEI